VRLTHHSPQHSLAYVEMATILAKMIYHFDMQLVHPAQDWRKQKVYIVWEKKPLMVTLTAREGR